MTQPFLKLMPEKKSGTFLVASRLSESETRYSLIDPDLKKAGWNLSDRTQVGFEIPVGDRLSRFEKPGKSDDEGITDYCLYRANGEVLAVIEAKRTSRDARVGQQQVLDYVTKIGKTQSFLPFAFMSNGQEVFFWDSEESAPRHVAGFFSRENLERLLWIKQNRIPLSTAQIKKSIVDRSYQVEAVRRICEVVEQKKKRKALLVMATGTGKTRTIMALIDVFLQARAAKKVLFLADRDALVEQARTDGFQRHLPNEAGGRIRSYDMERTKRVYVATLQTLEICYEQFSPADFDLVIADECHRSIYNKFTDVLAYFDAVQIGLTATPNHLVDHDTCKFFDCPPRVPTFLYPYEQAVEEGYLVNYSVYSAQTKFQRKGIKGVDLTEEERESLRQRGIDPDEIDFEGTDLERTVTNEDTLRRQIEEFMEVCLKDATGQLPGKSIIFAITQDHAGRIRRTFEEMYPEHAGRLVSLITSREERNKTLIDEFKKNDMPRIAISVDMLDTGVDIPEVVNLAFMKPVNSQIKFWQMIGRGTRAHETCTQYDWLPNQTKEYFLIVDFWENFEHFDMMGKDDQGPAQVPVLVTIFNTRLQKLRHLLGDQSSADFKRILTDVRADIALIPGTSFTVKKSIADLRQVQDDDFWTYLTGDKLEFLRLKIAPLLRFVTGINPREAFFISKMERAGLFLLQKKNLTHLIESIREDVSALPSALKAVQAVEEHRQALLANKFWAEATLERLDTAKTALAPVMRYAEPPRTEPLELGLDDIIDSRKWIIVRDKSGKQKLMVEEYKRQVEERILKLAESHPTIRKLKAGEFITVGDLESLEETLEKEFIALGLDEENILKAFGVRVGNLVEFLKHVLHVESLPTYESIVRRAFDAFILEHNYNADQSRFLRAVQNVFIERRKLELADLYEEPFTNFGMNAVKRLFDKKDVDELIRLTKKLVA